MKPTMAHAVKAAFTRKLHPQLSLDQRQSQRLVNLIASSFRQQLDREHAPGPTHPPPVEAHLQSVLTNPLFQKPSRISRNIATTGKTEIDALDPDVSPIDYFVQQAALGKATLDLAAAALARYTKRQRRPPVTEEEVRDSQQVVAPILNWLWASGLDESMQFVQDKMFTARLVKMLAISKRDEVVWRWHQKLLERAMKSADGKTRYRGTATLKARSLLGCFLRAKFSVAASSDDCLRELLKIVERPVAADHYLWRHVLQDATDIMTQELLQRPEASLLDAELYDQLVTSHLWTDAPKNLARTKLMLFAPEPDPSLATEFLGQELSWLTMNDTGPRTKQLRILFSLRTINILVDQGRQHDAARIVSLMQKYFPRETLAKDVGSDQPESIASLLNALLEHRPSLLTPSPV